MKDASKYLCEDDDLKTALIDLLVEEVGGSNPLPSVYEMAAEVRNAVDSELTTDLYKRVYTPLSAFFSHANGSVLMRHIKSNGSPRFRPSYPWNRRGPVRTADACFGLLALAVCGRTDEGSQDSEFFARYARAHLTRTLAPLPIMAGRGTRKAINWSRIPAALARIRESARYLHSDQGEKDGWDAQQMRIRTDLAVIMGVFQTEATAKLFPRIIDILTTMVVGPPPDAIDNTEAE